MTDFVGSPIAKLMWDPFGGEGTINNNASRLVEFIPKLCRYVLGSHLKNEPLEDKYHNSN